MDYKSEICKAINSQLGAAADIMIDAEGTGVYALPGF